MTSSQKSIPTLRNGGSPQEETAAGTEPGFRQLSAVLAIAGYLGIANNIVTLSTGDVSLYVLSAAVASGAFAAMNTWFALASDPRRWMLVLQAATISLAGILSAILTEITSFGGLVLFAMSLPLLAKRGAIRRPAGMIVLLAIGIAMDAGFSWVLHSQPITRSLAMTGVASAVIGVVYFAFQRELDLLMVELRTSNSVARKTDEQLRQARLDTLRARSDLDAATGRLQEAESRMENLLGSGSVEELIPVETYGLSSRELQVVRCLVETRGRNQDIARTLGIRERTVKSHLYHICNKTGLDSRVELIELFRPYWA